MRGTYHKLLIFIAMAAVLGGCNKPGSKPELTSWLDTQAQALLDQRDAKLATLTTRGQAEARQQEVREAILRVIGGLPETNAPLNAKVTGTIQMDRFRIERVHFDSLPNYPITANLYVPDVAGRRPGIVFSMGHWDAGKSVAYQTAGNLALNGFVVLVYDPVGQGERLQAYESRTGRSLAGGSTDQHFQDGTRALLGGQALTRWFVHDSKRALDYLVSRPEVDPERIGATGCSGGGTQTAFFAVLEPRLKAAAPACYITSFHELFAGSIGDSEQSPHGFIAAGLDQSDFIMAFAPKPYLVINTQDDFFPIAGARRAVAQARQFYKLFGAEGQVRHAVGPGGHGTPPEVRKELYAFFLQALSPIPITPHPVEEVRLKDLSEFEFQVTPSGQVSQDLKALDLSQVIAADLKPRYRTAAPDEIRKTLEQWTREPSPTLPTDSELLNPPADVPRQSTGFVVMQTGRSVEPVARELQRRGHPVLLVKPRGTPLEERANAYNAGWQEHTRAHLLGLSINGLRARDILNGVERLSKVEGVTHIRGYARRSGGVWLLMAAALDPRIEAVWVHQTPASWRELIDAPLHQRAFEIIVPSAALSFDIEDVRQLIAPRPVMFTDPMDAMRNVAKREGDYLFRPADSPDADYLDVFLSKR